MEHLRTQFPTHMTVVFRNFINAPQKSQQRETDLEFYNFREKS
jgi:hypothetical protein